MKHKLSNARKYSIWSSAVVLFCAGFAILSTRTCLGADWVTIQGGVHRQIGYIPLSDGIRLAYVVYLPATPGKYPAVLYYDAYRSSGAEFDSRHEGVSDWVKNGYAYVGVNVRGSACSQGRFFLLDPQEGKDGAQVINWIAKQIWSDRKVGMVGVSYPGITQFLTAANHPKYLVAIAAGGLVDNPYRANCYRGGIPNGYCEFWGYYAQPMVMAQGVRQRQAMGDRTCKGPNTERPLDATFYDVQKHPLNDAWWKERALDTYAKRINVPTLITGAWQDEQTGSAAPVRLFNMIASKHKRLIMTNGMHDTYAYLLDEIPWMNHWLKGAGDGAETEPPVSVWFETQFKGSAAQPAWIENFSQWPPKRTQWVRFYLTADGGLSSSLPSGNQAGSRSYLYPWGSENISDNQSFATPPVPWGSLAFRTPVMSDDTTIVGAPRLVLYVSSTQKDTDFMFVLHDIGPDGSVLFLQRDYLRASMRQVDPSRSDPGFVYLPLDHPEPMLSGRVYRVELSIMPFAHVLRKGHRLELMIMAPPNTPSPFWEEVPLGDPALNTVYFAASQPSSLTIPKIPGLMARAKAPVCGSLPLQPCRYTDTKPLIVPK